MRTLIIGILLAAAMLGPPRTLRAHEPEAAAPPPETPVGEGYDRFNAAMALGYARFRDHITDLQVAGTPVAMDDTYSAELAFTLDLMFPVCSSALWVGTSLMLSSGSDGTRNSFDRETLLTHGSANVQLRYNVYPWTFLNVFPYVSIEKGLFSHSFMVPYAGKPLRLSANGSGGGVTIGLQRRDGAFVALVYQTYALDEFDVQLKGDPANLDVTGKVEGKGVQLLFGYRWF